MVYPPDHIATRGHPRLSVDDVTLSEYKRLLVGNSVRKVERMTEGRWNGFYRIEFRDGSVLRVMDSYLTGPGPGRQ